MLILSNRRYGNENFEFSLAADNLYDFTWNKLADWYLEVAKRKIHEILVYLLKNILIMWHPFIPYVTEAIWQSFNESIIMVEQWPAWDDVQNRLAADSGQSTKILPIFRKLLLGFAMLAGKIKLSRLGKYKPSSWAKGRIC